MATTIKLYVDQKREIFVKDNEERFRVITKISQVEIIKDGEAPMFPVIEVPPSPDSGLPPYITNVANLAQNIFLMRKIGTSEEELSISDFIRIASPEDFKEEGMDDPCLNIDNTTWTEMLQKGYVSNYVSISSNPETVKSSSITTSHHYYLSSILVREYETADIAMNDAENVILSLKAFVKRFNDSFKDFSTEDTEIYPTGWEKIVYE